MSSVRIQEARLTHLWFEQDPELLGESAPVGVLDFLRDEAAYWARFDSVRRYQGDPQGLTPPWPEHVGKSFWSLYLGRRPQDVEAHHAWARLVPLRYRLKGDHGFPHRPIRGHAEGFFFPTGRAIMLSTRIAAPQDTGLSLEELVEYAHDSRSEGEISVKMQDGSESSRSVKAFAADALTDIRAAARGPGSPAGVISRFSVTTVTRVEGIDAGQAVEAGSDVHRVVTALSRWPSRETWKLVALPGSLDDALPDRDGVPGHFHLTDGEGRMSWLPALGAKKIRCYHRNQSLAAMQVEALGRMVGATVLRPALSASHQRLAKKAAGLLRRIYGATRDTYRSQACQRQIVERGFLGDLRQLSSRWGWPDME